MNKRLILISGLLSLVCLLLWWLWQPPKQPSLEAGQTFPNAPTESGAKTASPPAPSRLEGNIPPGAKQRSRQARLQDWNSRSNDFYQALVNSNVPLDFYGKVVDEASSAIAGATVSLAWNKDSMSNPLPSGENTLTTQSDFAGLFSLQGERGRYLGIRMSKEGYYTPRPGTWSFNFSAETRFSPESPVVFMLRKKGAPEPLIHIAGIGTRAMRDFPLVADGRPTEVSLRDGSVAARRKHNSTGPRRFEGRV